MLETRVRFPVGHIDAADAAYHQLQFALVERPQQMAGYQLGKACECQSHTHTHKLLHMHLLEKTTRRPCRLSHTSLQGEKLLLDAAHEAIVDVQLDVLLLVALGDGDGGAVRLQLVHLQHAETVVLHAERRVDHVFDIIVTVWA